MTDDCFDDAFDRYLAGRPVPAQAAALVAFADHARAVAAHPVRPSAQLAQLLTHGLIGASDTTTIAAVPPASVAPPGQHRRGRRTIVDVLTAAAARVASAGALPQAVLGVGLVLAGVTGAGAAGVLPGPVQDEVSAVVEAVTPFDVPDSADHMPTPREQPGPEVGVGTQPGGAQDGESPAETPVQAGFGREVSQSAPHGGVSGDDVSDRASGTHGPVAPATAAPRHPATERPVPANSAPDQDGTAAQSGAGPVLPGSPPNADPGRP